MRLLCDSGVFEMHSVGGTAMLVAIDNRILTLDRSPGALSSDTAADGVVRQLLTGHFAGDRGFTTALVRGKRRWLSRGLDSTIARYLAAERPAGDVPPVNGDPFTDSQEDPTRFAVGAARVEGRRASVHVRFADAFAERSVAYRLVREGGGWRVDDLSFDGGETLRGILR